MSPIYVRFYSRPRSEGLQVGLSHTMDVLSPVICVHCHSDWLFHGESCPRLDVVHPGRAWSSLSACTWHCSLHYLFLQATPLFPDGIILWPYYSFLALMTVSNSSFFTPALLRTHSFVFFAVRKSRRIFPMQAFHPNVWLYTSHHRLILASCWSLPAMKY